MVVLDVTVALVERELQIRVLQVVRLVRDLVALVVEALALLAAGVELLLGVLVEMESALASRDLQLQGPAVAEALVKMALVQVAQADLAVAAQVRQLLVVVAHLEQQELQIPAAVAAVAHTAVERLLEVATAVRV